MAVVVRSLGRVVEGPGEGTYSVEGDDGFLSRDDTMERRDLWVLEVEGTWGELVVTRPA